MDLDGCQNSMADRHQNRADPDDLDQEIDGDQVECNECPEYQRVGMRCADVHRVTPLYPVPPRSSDSESTPLQPLNAKFPFPPPMSSLLCNTMLSVAFSSIPVKATHRAVTETKLPCMARSPSVHGVPFLSDRRWKLSLAGPKKNQRLSGIRGWNPAVGDKAEVSIHVISAFQIQPACFTLPWRNTRKSTHTDVHR